LQLGGHNHLQQEEGPNWQVEVCFRRREKTDNELENKRFNSGCNEALSHLYFRSFDSASTGWAMQPRGIIQAAPINGWSCLPAPPSALNPVQCPTRRAAYWLASRYYRAGTHLRYPRYFKGIIYSLKNKILKFEPYSCSRNRYHP